MHTKRALGLLVGGAALIVHMLLRPIFGVEAHYSSIILYMGLSWALILIAWEFLLRDLFISLINYVKKFIDKPTVKQLFPKKFDEGPSWPDY